LCIVNTIGGGGIIVLKLFSDDSIASLEMVDVEVI
jgi:hypothetical protein